MKKQVIRITESDLHKIIKESVKKIIKEWDRDINPDDEEEFRRYMGYDEYDDYEKDPLDHRRD